jgi:hypothetical protein
LRFLRRDRPCVGGATRIPAAGTAKKKHKVTKKKAARKPAAARR